MKIRNSINYDRKTDSNPEKNTLPSNTIPNQSMSAREILDRTIRGLPIQGAKVPVYDSEQILPDPRTMDLADLQELREKAQQEVKEIENRLKAQNKAQLEAKKLAAAAPVQKEIEMPEGQLPPQYPKKTAPPETGGGGGR